MDALLDANVVLNFSTGRNDPFLHDSEKIMELAADGRFNGYIAFHSLSVIWYVLRRGRTVEQTRQSLGLICDILTTVSIPHSQIVKAIHNKAFSDFEDCLQDECASFMNADYLVTCNGKDFAAAKTKIVSPAEFLSILEKKDC